MSEINPPDGSPVFDSVVSKGRNLFFAVAVLTTAPWFPPDFSFLQEEPGVRTFSDGLGIAFLTVQIFLLAWIWLRGSQTARKLLLSVSLFGMFTMAVITGLLFYFYLTSGLIQRSEPWASYVLHTALVGLLCVCVYAIAVVFLMSKSLSAFVDVRFDKRISALAASARQNGS